MSMPKIAVHYPQHLLEAMEKDKPSKEPSFWAKKNCRDCCGRGVVGKTTRTVGNGNKIINEQLCACVKKNFAAWQAKWVEDHQDKVVVEDKPVQVSALDPDMSQKSTTESRIERIDGLCQTLKDEINKLQSRRDQLPEDHKVDSFLAAIEEAKTVLDMHKTELKELIQYAENLDGQAEKMYEQVKALRAKAEVCRTKDQSAKQQAIRDAEDVLRSREEALEQTQALLRRDTHRMNRKLNELRDKLDRLEDRRLKVVKESGLDQVTTQEIEMPAESPA